MVLPILIKTVLSFEKCGRGFEKTTLVVSKIWEIFRALLKHLWCVLFFAKLQAQRKVVPLGSLLNCVLGVLAFSRVWRSHMFSMLACFMSLRACSHVLHAGCAQISYVLTCFFDIACPIFFTFEKLNSKILI